MYKSLLQPLLFLLPPERAHHVTFKLLRLISSIPGGKALITSLYKHKRVGAPVTRFGLNFPNSVGLAAGLDKNGEFIKQLALLGFGHVEVGTVTPRPQPGNPQPRLFRLKKDRALINRMGFNNHGVEALAKRLEKLDTSIIVGANIGKNKDTPEENAHEDYLKCVKRLVGLVDYFTVNVSSPNTPNLRQLQEKEPLRKILQSLIDEIKAKGHSTPVLLKIAPDLTNEAIDDIVQIVQEVGIAGIVATNTTIERSGLLTEKEKVETIGAGGLSGMPLKKRSTEVIRYLAKKSNGSFEIVGVGGIYSAEDAREKLDAGAGLVQIYSGMIYEGPGLIKNIVNAVDK